MSTAFQSNSCIHRPWCTSSRHSSNSRRRPGTLSSSTWTAKFCSADYSLERSTQKSIPSQKLLLVFRPNDKLIRRFALSASAYMAKKIEIFVIIAFSSCSTDWYDNGGPSFSVPSLMFIKCGVYGAKVFESIVRVSDKLYVHSFIYVGYFFRVQKW